MAAALLGRACCWPAARVAAWDAAWGGRRCRPQEKLANPALEARAEAIGRTLRCLVCQNESIEESGADLAHDLRVLLRQRLAAGDSNAQAVQYIVARYGQFVLLRPPVEPATWRAVVRPGRAAAGGRAGHRALAAAPAAPGRARRGAAVERGRAPTAR